jgi:hypothetical protein
MGFRVLISRRTVSGIFSTINRRDVRRISIKIRSSDSKLLAVFVNPFPEAFSGNPPLRPIRAFNAHDIGREPVAVPRKLPPW